MQVTYAKRSGVSMFAGNGTWTEIAASTPAKNSQPRVFPETSPG